VGIVYPLIMLFWYWISAKQERSTV
jgi:hypothetical protein